MKQQAIETIIDYLTSIPAWYLATVEEDQPHVRPFSFAAAQDDRIWFCTATTKDVYRELEKNPKFELTAWKPGRVGSSCAGAPTSTTEPTTTSAARVRAPRRARRMLRRPERPDAHVLLLHRRPSVGVQHRRQLDAHRDVGRRRGYAGPIGRAAARLRRHGRKPSEPCNAPARYPCAGARSGNSRNMRSTATR